MIGDLLASFCERGESGGTRCLELWTYPDQTLNVVVTRVSREAEAEYSFPCAPSQVFSVLKGLRSFRSENGSANSVLERADDQVLAKVRTGSDEWQQQVPVASIQSALESVGYMN